MMFCGDTTTQQQHIVHLRNSMISVLGYILEKVIFLGRETLVTTSKR